MRKQLLRKFKNFGRNGKVNKQIELAQRDYDLNKAAELKYGRLPS